MTGHARLTAGVLGLVLLTQWHAVSGAEEGPKRWEPQIRAFEAEDERNPPPSGGVLFIGSSSIRGWDLDRWFSDLPAINRGFGGSQIEDSTHYADRIAFPHRPEVIVLYAGDNDIAAGKSPGEVFEDYKAFVRKVRTELAETRIIFIAIKPSLPDTPAGRWHLAPQMGLANAMVRSYAARRDGLQYADIFTPMLNDDGRPRPELFAEDGLHLSDEGYALWTELLRPQIERARRGGEESGAE